MAAQNGPWSTSSSTCPSPTEGASGDRAGRAAPSPSDSSTASEDDSSWPSHASDLELNRNCASLEAIEPPILAPSSTHDIITRLAGKIPEPNGTCASPRGLAPPAPLCGRLQYLVASESSDRDHACWGTMGWFDLEPQPTLLDSEMFVHSIRAFETAGLNAYCQAKPFVASVALRGVGGPSALSWPNELCRACRRRLPRSLSALVAPDSIRTRNDDGKERIYTYSIFPQGGPVP